MNDLLIPLLISTLAGLSTMLGALLIFIKTRNYHKFICFCLSFSIAVMISISIFDLIPESFFMISASYGFIKSIIILLLSFVISYIVITILGKLINREVKTNDLYKLGLLNMLVLILHNFPEGIATFISSYHNINLGIKLSLAIMLHNIPEGISIAVPIYYATGSYKKTFRATFISGISEPIGAILAYIILKNYINELLISIILVIVAGLMITLSIQEMLPKALKYKDNKLLYMGLLLGLILVIINMLLF